MILIEFLVGSFVVSIPITISNVFDAYQSRTLKHSSFWESARPLVPLLSLFIITSGWAVYSPSEIIYSEPRLFYFMVGTVFSNIAVCFNVLLFFLISS